jgi:hypothetical protein
MKIQKYNNTEKRTHQQYQVSHRTDWTDVHIRPLQFSYRSYTYGGEQRFWWKNLRERDQLEDPEVDGITT